MFMKTFEYHCWMKSYFISFLILLIAFSLQAQIKLPPKENKTQVKQVPAKTSDSNPVNSGPTLTLKIISNADCKFYLDGELKTILAKDEIEKIQLKAGDYQFKAISTANSADIYKEIHTVRKEEIGTERFFEINLQSIINLRLAEERLAIQREKESDANEIAFEKKSEAEKTEKENAEREKAQTINAKEKQQADFAARQNEFLNNTDNIKPFKGKIVSETTWDNVTPDMKEYYKDGNTVQYYTDNKYRLEMNSSEMVKTTIIYDYERNESLSLLTMNISGKETKTATLQKTNKQDWKLESIEYFDEYKTIQGYNCQKAYYHLHQNSDATLKDLKMNCFVDRSFYTPGEGFSENNIVPFITFDYNCGFNTNGFIYNSKVVSISEEPVDDYLFSLIPPKGYKLTDNR